MVLVLQQNRWPWADVSDKGAFVKTVLARPPFISQSCFALKGLTRQDNTVTFSNRFLLLRPVSSPTMTPRFVLNCVI